MENTQYFCERKEEQLKEYPPYFLYVPNFLVGFRDR